MLNISSTLKVRQALFSFRPIPHMDKYGFTWRMDIKQIRRANMISLIEQEPSKAAFARKVGTDPAYISQLLSTKTKAEIGNDLARSIETAYRKPHGWMDREHGAVEEAPSGEYSALIAAWDLLTRDEKEPILSDIQRRAAHNQAVVEELSKAASKPSTVRVADRRKRRVNFDRPERRINKEDHHD